MLPADSVGNMLTLDRWRHEIGLVYEAEKPAQYSFTITRRPLARQAHPSMQYGRLSNQFSLAEMLEAPWPEYLCVSAHAVAFREWLTATQIPLLPWSSQARGFFTDRAAPELRDHAEMVRCWYSDGNLGRRERAFELARQRGVEPINIALAWVLKQPFLTFPLIGPRRHRELWSCLRALELPLCPAETHWLETG